jgi:flagellar biosynthetic protein FliO
MMLLGWQPWRSRFAVPVILAVVALAALGWQLTRADTHRAAAPVSSSEFHVSRSDSATRNSEPETRNSEATASAPLADRADPLDLPGTAVDITLKLLVVLALAYGVLALLQRYSLGLGHRHGTLQVVESTTLAPNRALYVVRVGADHLLIGVTASRITVLDRWSPESLPESFAERLRAAESSPRPD